MHSGNPEIVYFRKYQRTPDDEEKKIMNKCIQTMLQSHYISYPLSQKCTLCVYCVIFHSETPSKYHLFLNLYEDKPT